MPCTLARRTQVLLGISYVYVLADIFVCERFINEVLFRVFSM